MSTQDIVQLPYQHIGHFEGEDLKAAIERNFNEVARMLYILQMYEKKTGKPVNETVGSVTDENGNLLTSKLNEKMIGLQNELQLNDEAVTAAKLAVAAVVAEKIQDGAVVADKIAANAVTAVKIAAGAVVAEKIAAGAVTADKLSVNELSAITAYLGTIVGGRIYSGVFSTAAEGSDSGILLTNDGYFFARSNGQDIVEIRGFNEDGNIYLNRKADGSTFGKIIRATDYYPGLAITTENTGEGLSLRSADNITILPGSTGKCNVYGPFHVWDTEKDCIECTSAGPVVFHAYELPENKYGDDGVAELINGECRINMHPLFMECVAPDSESPWVIDLTPYGKFTIYVDEIGDGYFIIKSHQDGINGKFSWNVKAVKKKSIGKRYTIEGEDDMHLLETNWEDNLLEEVELDVR